jgi:transcriptional regulator with XRE-family HTH domain
MQEQLQAVRERIGRNVRQLRIARGWTQEQLAERVGNTERHVGQVERGEVNVTIDILTTMAAHLSVDVARLLDDSTGGASDARVYTIMPSLFDQIEEALRAVARLKDTGRPAEPPDRG